MTGVPPPREGRIHGPQLRALVRMTLRETFRGGVDLNSGVRVRPLVQIVFSMGLIGLISAGNVSRFSDAPSYLAVLFTTVSLLLAMAVIPDTHDVRQKKVEVIGSKPVSRATQGLAAILSQLVAVALIAALLGLPGILAAGARHGLGGAAQAALFASLIVGSFSTTVLSLGVILQLSLRLGVDRLRSASQTLLVLLVLLLMLVSSASLFVGVVRPGDPVSLSGQAWVRALPPVWFVDGVLGGPHPALARGGALAIVALAAAFLLAIVRGRAFVELNEKLLAVAPPSIRRSLAARALGLAGSSRRAAIATLLLEASGREDTARLRLLAPRVMQLGCFALWLWGPFRGSTGLAVLAAFCLTDLGPGLEMLKQGANPAAAWPLAAAPIRAGELFGGMRLAGLIRHFALGWTLMTVALVAEQGALVGGLLALVYLGLGRVFAAALLALRPGLPLASEMSAGQGLRAASLVSVFALAGIIAFALLVGLVGVFARRGALLALLALVQVVLADLGLSALARRRLGALELAA